MPVILWSLSYLIWNLEVLEKTNAQSGLWHTLHVDHSSGTSVIHSNGFTLSRSMASSPPGVDMMRSWMLVTD